MAPKNQLKGQGHIVAQTSSVEQERKKLAEWRAKQVQNVTLPSGMQAKVRKCTMTDLMLTGKLPPSILGMAQEAQRNGQEALDLEAVGRNAGEFREMLDLITKLSLVSPALALDGDGDEDHVSLAEISGDDKMAIFNLINGEVGELRTFHEGEAPREER